MDIQNQRKRSRSSTVTTTTTTTTTAFGSNTTTTSSSSQMVVHPFHNISRSRRAGSMSEETELDLALAMSVASSDNVQEEQLYEGGPLHSSSSSSRRSSSGRSCSSSQIGRSSSSSSQISSSSSSSNSSQIWNSSNSIRGAVTDTGISPRVFWDLFSRAKPILPFDVVLAIWPFLLQKRDFLKLLSTADALSLSSVRDVCLSPDTADSWDWHTASADAMQERLRNDGIGRMLSGAVLQDRDMDDLLKLVRTTRALQVFGQNDVLIPSIWLEHRFLETGTRSQGKKTTQRKLKKQHPKREAPLWNWNIVLFVRQILGQSWDNDWVLGAIDFSLRQFRFYDSGDKSDASSTFHFLQVHCKSTQ
jgi:hypothetical protein